MGLRKINNTYIRLLVLISSIYSGLVFSAECYESTIISPTPFLGNNEEIFKLSDGSVWEVKYEYEYLYEYYPSVIVCPNRGMLMLGETSLNVELLSTPKGSKNRSQSEWELFEETHIEGYINGYIQQGSVYKTTSGSIYEVTGPTLQLVLLLQPAVMVLRNGNTFKLVIEGVAEQLICAKLK
jgi:hypothetical protein|tara:strand:- start:64 stop:609 length:546 start_codon:yes stop_codon:yes gene_type:complete